jgi:cation transporter-like permease
MNIQFGKHSSGNESRIRSTWRNVEVVARSSAVGISWLVVMTFLAHGAERLVVLRTNLNDLEGAVLPTLFFSLISLALCVGFVFVSKR